MINTFVFYYQNLTSERHILISHEGFENYVFKECKLDVRCSPDEAEEIEEVKCEIIKGEFELHNTEMSGINEEYRKFLTTEYNDTSGKCIITFIIIDDTGALHINADGTPFVYNGEISGTSDNIAIKLGSNEYTGKLEDNDGLTHADSDRHHSHDDDSGDSNALGEGKGCIDYNDLNENGAYDSDEPCHDDDSGDNNAPGEEEGCIDYDDLNENGAYDSDEPCHDDEAAVSHNISVNSLEDVFNNMNEDGEYYYTKEEWVIHDISEIVEIDGMLMFGVTGKAQEDGYNCGLETWYILTVHYGLQISSVTAQCIILYQCQMKIVMKTHRVVSV